MSGSGVKRTQPWTMAWATRMRSNGSRWSGGSWATWSAGSTAIDQGCARGSNRCKLPPHEHYRGCETAQARYGRCFPGFPAAQGRRHAGSGLLVGPAVPSDGGHSGVLAARRGGDPQDDRIPVLGGARLLLQVSVVTADRPARRTPVGQAAGPAAGLDDDRPAHRGRRSAGHGADPAAGRPHGSGSGGAGGGFRLGDPGHRGGRLAHRSRRHERRARPPFQRLSARLPDRHHHQ